MKTPEDWLEFLIGALILGSFSIAISAFILALGWLSVSEMIK
jgi:hypothetical protein